MKSVLKLPTIILALSATAVSCSSDDDGENVDPGYLTLHAAGVTVIDYRPAPGQFVNEIPEWEPGDDHAAMCRKASEMINDGSIVTLGAFGGSITMKLDRPIKNHPDTPDFIILGNAISTSAEPGHIYVSEDGEHWYLCVGEVGYSPSWIVTVTYRRPADGFTDENYIPWSLSYPDGTGKTGYLSRVPQYHQQDYYPAWVDSDEITCSAIRLPDNGWFDEATGQYVLSPYTGYADSYPNGTYDSLIELDNVCDSNGDLYNIGEVRYIRVVTGVLQNNGPLGECSTEVGQIYIVTDEE